MPFRRLPLFILPAALPLLLGGCRAAESEAHAHTPAPTRALAVKVAAPTTGPVPRPIRGTGVVRHKSEADLSFKAGGIVTAVLVDEGARVKKGQVLARLDPTEVGAVLRQANEGANKAERDLERVKRLHATGAVALVELQNAQTGVDLARAGVDAAAFNASRATIVAPDDGRIDRRFVEPGEVVAPGRPVVHLSGRSKGAIVRLGVSDRDALRVREGDEAKVTVDAKPEAPLVGHVSQIATVASAGSGTFEIEVKIDGDGEALLSGLTAKIAIVHDELVAAVVPIGAVVEGHGTEGAVFVVDGARAKKVPVKIAFLVDGGVALAAPTFDPSTRIVEAGSAELTDGAAIRIVP